MRSQRTFTPDKNKVGLRERAIGLTPPAAANVEGQELSIGEIPDNLVHERSALIVRNKGDLRENYLGPPERLGSPFQDF